MGNGVIFAIDSRDWEATSKAFWVAEQEYPMLCGREATGEDVEHGALATAEKSLRAAATDVVRYETHDPKALDDKEKMYLALMHAAAGCDAAWLEQIAVAVMASTGVIERVG